MNFGCWGTGLGHDKAIRRSADRVQNQAVLRAGTVNQVPSSIMRKFIYKSGRTQSAQGRETCP